MKPPLWLYVLAAIVVAALIAWGLWSFDPFGRRKHAEAKAEVAAQQTHVEAAKTEAVERVIRSEVVIHQVAQEAISHVQQAQGSDAPLDPAVASAVRDGVERLRKPPTPSDADRPADAAGSVR
ncbi:hypothetical protein [Caulobacter segnis]